jgi:hypothetical protein
VRELTPTEQHQVYGGLKAKDLPPVTVHPDPGAGGGGYARPPQGSPPSPPRGGGGGGGASPTYGNYNLRADTLEHRLEIANLVQDDLEKLGYHMPNGYKAGYNDHYAYRNKATGQLRYTDTRVDPAPGEVEIASTTDSSNHTIYLFHGAVDPKLNPNGNFGWNYVKLDSTTNQPSMTGTVTTRPLDGGMSPVAWALASLAHEEYHASGHFAVQNDNELDRNELSANTYGCMAERALTKAIINERNGK